MKIRKRTEADEVVKVALKKMDKEHKEDQPKLRRKNLLSSGSTLLNLACSNNPYGSFLKGKYYFLVGDSTSGKTFLSMTCFAEALLNPHFKNYRLIYDNVEDGCLLDLESLFNKQVAKQVEAPGKDEDGNPAYSFTVEEFYYHLDDAIQQARENGQPFIYVLDSMDSLSSQAENGKFEEHKEAHRKGKETAGSYGDGKAKKNSEGLRKVLKGLRDTDSILLIISQTRDSLGFGFETKTRSGGHSLRFYATVEIWTSVVGSIKKTVKGKERNIGVKVKAKIKKNRITGEKHEVLMDIYPEYGIDDIGSCIDYLIAEGKWTKGKIIDAVGLDFKGTRTAIIQHIENNNLIRELQSIVGECWKEIKEACSLNRRKKYGED